MKSSLKSNPTFCIVYVTLMPDWVLNGFECSSSYNLLSFFLFVTFLVIYSLNTSSISCLPWVNHRLHLRISTIVFSCCVNLASKPAEHVVNNTQ